MASVFTLIKKNFNLLINAKFSSIVFIIGPILLILAISISLSNTSMKNISCGFISSPDVEEDIRVHFISEAGERSFNIIEYYSLEDCKQAVVSGKINVCVHLKKDSLDSLDTTNISYNYVLDTYVDFSQQRIVWSIIGTIQWIGEDLSDQMRAEGVSQIKAKIAKYDSEIQKIEGILNGMPSQIENIRSGLSVIKANTENSQIAISNIRDSASNLMFQLNQIKIFAPSNISQKVQNAIDYLYNIQEGINSISNNNYADLILIEDIDNKLMNLKNSILTINNFLYNLKVDLDEIQDSDLEKIATPVSVKSYSVIDDFSGDLKGDLTDLDYLFPNFIMFFILFSSIAYGSINIIRERSSNAYIRNVSSKVKGFNFVFSNFFTTFIIVLFQIILLFLISSFFLNLDILHNLLNISLFLALSISILILIGIALGFLFNSNESAIVGGILVSLLFFMFSSLISPIETLPRLISKIVSLSPFSILEDCLRKILMFNSGIYMSNIKIISLALSCLVIIFFIWIFYKKSKEKEI